MESRKTHLIILCWSDFVKMRWKTYNTTLSEQFQNQTYNTTLSEQFQNQIYNTTLSEQFQNQTYKTTLSEQNQLSKI